MLLKKDFRREREKSFCACATNELPHIQQMVLIMEEKRNERISFLMNECGTQRADEKNLWMEHLRLFCFNDLILSHSWCWWLITIVFRCAQRWALRELALLIASMRSATFVRRSTCGCTSIVPTLEAPSSVPSSELGWRESRRLIRSRSTHRSGWWCILIAPQCGEFMCELIKQLPVDSDKSLRGSCAMLTRLWNFLSIASAYKSNKLCVNLLDEYLRAKTNQ